VLFDTTYLLGILQVHSTYLADFRISIQGNRQREFPEYYLLSRSRVIRSAT